MIIIINSLNSYMYNYLFTSSYSSLFFLKAACISLALILASSGVNLGLLAIYPDINNL